MLSSRQSFLRTSALAGASAALVSPGTAASGGGSRPRTGAVDIGSRLELFVDEFLVEKWDGQAEWRMHQPAPQEIVLTHDEFWEGNASCNHTIFQDGDRYRMCYRGSHLDLSGGKINFSSSAAGGLRVELQDEGGAPHPGFALEDCSPVFGDSLPRTVTWKTGSDLSSLGGRPVRLRFFFQRRRSLLDPVQKEGLKSP